VIPQRGGGVETLPPKGDARREVLREREDALAEAAEAAGEETQRIDPEKLKVDPEIAQHFNEFNELEVSNPDPLFVYKWENAGSHGRFIRASMVQGWAVVQGTDEEALEHKGVAADTTRRVGDTILMKCRKDRYLLILRQRKARQAAMEGAASENLADLGQRAGTRVYTPEDIANPADKHAANVSKMVTAHAQQIGRQQLDERIRTGRIPGMPAPGAAR
jgi:hypothetical protein